MPVFNKLIYDGTEYTLWWWGNIWEPLNLTVTTSWLDATITWEDNEIWTIPPTTFQKSELVRKIGSAPTSPSDWTLVVTETVKDTYKTTWYVDQWLTDWTTYYYRVFSYSDLWWISYCDAKSVTPSPWWQPWVNTYVYYPLDWDLKDYSWNNRDLSWSWITYETLWDIQVWVFNNVSATYTNDWLNWWSEYTYSVFTQTDTVPTWYPVAWFPYHTAVLSISNQWNINDYGRVVWFGLWWALSEEYYNGMMNVASWGTVSTNTWYHLVSTRDGSSLKTYLNWVLVWTASLRWIGSHSNATLNVAFQRNTSDSVKYGWKISKVILENKARTAQEISKYYNQTKSDYWL